MRATTVVTLGAGMLLGGLVFAAFVPPLDGAQLGGGATELSAVVKRGDARIDGIVEESLRHAQAADAAISDGRVRTKTTPPSMAAEAPGESVAADAAIAKSADWQPPPHDLRQGVYFDEKTLLLVGPRWIYEWHGRPGGENLNPTSAGTIVYGLIPMVAMGYMQGEHFVRWAAGYGWLPNDVAGPQHARRRTRLQRKGTQLCVHARCLQYSSAVSPYPAAGLSPLSAPTVFDKYGHVGPLTTLVQERPLPTGLPRSEVGFSISWVDARHGTHTWASLPGPTPGLSGPVQIRHTRRPPPANRVMPALTPRVVAGWPAVTPDRVRCVCSASDCADDDRSAHVVAAQEIQWQGVPVRRGRWQCDRPDARRRWSLQPMGFKGEAILKDSQDTGPHLRLPKTFSATPATAQTATAFAVFSENRTILWHFEAQTDGTLKAHRNGAQTAVILPALPKPIRERR